MRRRRQVRSINKSRLGVINGKGNQVEKTKSVISQEHFQELKNRELLIAAEIERDGVAL